MTIRKIATIGHPVLREVARDVTREELGSPETQRFIDDLIETMRDANGAGLAANQVYVPVRIAAVEVKNNPRYPYMPAFPLTVFVNARVELLTEERFLNYEGCLSVPNLRGEVPRAPHIRITAWDRTGAPLVVEAKGLIAGVFQHELDHLDGGLFVDRVADPRSLSTWTDFERFHLTAFSERARAVVARWGS